MKTTTARPADPQPTRVVVVDLERPAPRLADDGRYGNAMIVGCRGGVPCGAIEVDLCAEPSTIDTQLEELYAQTFLPAVDPAAALTDAQLPSISVVVPTIVARKADLELLLDGFSRAEYPDVEFILVDNRVELPTDDPLPQLLQDRPWVRVVREAHAGISAARNAGVDAARGEIVVFTDDDVRVDPHWLRAIGRRFAQQPGLNAVTGMILPAELETAAQIFFERYYGGFSGTRVFERLTLESSRTGSRLLRGSRVVVRDINGHELRQFSVYGSGAYGAGANMAFRRTTLVGLGGFDLALGTGTPARGGEDLAAMISVLWGGGSIGYEPGSVVYHRHRREVDELLHQLRGNGLGFTAMLTSLIAHDRRHLLGLASQVPLATRQMLRQSLARVRGRKPGTSEKASAPADKQYPAQLVRSELSGYPRGPVAYLRSRRALTAVQKAAAANRVVSTQGWGRSGT